MWDWQVQVQDTIFKATENLFQVIKLFRPFECDTDWNLGGRNQAKGLKQKVYAKQYQSYKCIARGHGSNKDKNFKRILKMETRHSELGKGDFISIPVEWEETWMEWLFEVPLHKALDGHCHRSSGRMDEQDSITQRLYDSW